MLALLFSLSLIAVSPDHLSAHATPGIDGVDARVLALVDALASSPAMFDEPVEPDPNCPHCQIKYPDNSSGNPNPQKPMEGPVEVLIEVKWTNTGPSYEGQCTKTGTTCGALNCKTTLTAEVKNTTGATITYNYTGGGNPKTLASGPVTASHNFAVDRACDSTQTIEWTLSWTINQVNHSATLSSVIGCHPCPTGPQ